MSRIMVQVRGETRPLTFGGNAPRLISSKSAWTGLPFEVHGITGREGFGETGPRPGEHALTILTEGRLETVVRGTHGTVSSRSTRGAMTFVSGNTPAYIEEVKGDAELVVFELTPEWLQYAPVDPRTFRRIGPLSGGDTAHALVSAMRDELARECAGGRLYAESLSLSLLSYACSHLPADDGEDESALSAPERERLESYVREHLERDLGLIELAELVGLSPRRLSERFRRSFGTTPHRYVVRTRLMQGARLLASGRYDIAETALRVGFCSQSHFTAAFRRAFGQTPARYASEHRGRQARTAPAR